MPKCYRHYVGGIYEFVCEVKLESDPSIIMVVYKSADGSVWTRPWDVFFELVEVDGISVTKFSSIG
jgi:hypothetical protein